MYRASSVRGASDVQRLHPAAACASAHLARRLGLASRTLPGFKDEIESAGHWTEDDAYLGAAAPESSAVI